MTMAENTNDPGAGVDAQGRAVLDPTRNVLGLVDAAIQRQDDLREMEARHQKEVADLRADYDDKLRRAESERIDAIRAVDVGNVAAAAAVSAQQASTLASQVATSADTLRNQVAAAAQAATVALAAALDPIQKDIADLRRAQYEAQGQKTQVVETQASGSSRGAWIGLAVAAAFGLLGFLLGIAGLIYTLTK